MKGQNGSQKTHEHLTDLFEAHEVSDSSRNVDVRDWQNTKIKCTNGTATTCNELARASARARAHLVRCFACKNAVHFY